MHNTVDTETAVEISGLEKNFGSGRAGRAIDEVSLSVPKNSFFTLLGPSGCGKTTTLRCLAGLESADRGTITMSGRTVFSSAQRRDVPPDRRPIAMVPQSYGIWPHMTVFDNAAFPLRYGRTTCSRTEAKARVLGMLAQVGLSEYSDKWSTQLSGGQQQRLALARALLCEPEVLLLDEPLSNLDAKLRAQLRVELRSFQRDFAVTTIYVTHDQDEALAMSDTVVVMNRGRVEQVGPPREIYEAPASRFVADFVGSANLLPGALDDAADVSGGGPVVARTAVGVVHCGRSATPPTSPSAGQEMTVCVRPENVQVLGADAIGTSRPNQFAGRVAAVEYSGERQELQIVVGDTSLRAHASAGLRVGQGDQVGVVLDPVTTIALWS